MELMYDDLEYNEFFNRLQTVYLDKYKEAQQKQWLICVPSNKSLKRIIINKAFVDLHVLRPSPFFKSHYVSTDVNTTITVEMEGACLKTSSGMIHILTEETAYNDDYKPYKILLIDKPLFCSTTSKDEAQTHTSSQKTPILSLKECTIFLESLDGCSRNLKMLNRKLDAFNSSYIILPEYLADAAVKVHTIIQGVVKEFFSSVQNFPPEKCSKPELTSILENYILCNVHNKLFPVIKKHCLEDDMKMSEKLSILYDNNITPDQLGVGERFCCQTPRAVVELASLNSLCSPSEKLHCLMMTLELLNQDLEQYLSTSCFVASSSKDHLTSDDLIPLLVNVVIQARPQYLVSNLYYIQNFCWEMSAVDKYSFVLVTFQAAKEFLMNHEFSISKHSTRKVKKELSLEELMEATSEFQNKTESPTPAHSSPLDHQLEKVTKMIEASTREIKPPQDEFFRKRKEYSAKEENLGDFITSLQQKTLGVSYGKQT